MKKLFLEMIQFYQKFLTVFSYGSCRYHPTCSQYCLWQLENSSFFKAIYFTILRLLRCNGFFVGGIDYPKIYYSRKPVMFKKIVVKYWHIPTKNSKCYIIKNHHWKKKNEQSK